MVGKYCLNNPWAHSTQICQIFLYAYVQWGNGGNGEKRNSIPKMYIKWQLYNLDLASYVKLMVGKYCSKNALANTTQICEIYLFAYEQWGVEVVKNETVFTKCISNGNCATWIWLHMWSRWWKVLLEEPVSRHNSNMQGIPFSICSVRGWNGKQLNRINKMYFKWQLYNLDLVSYV